MTSQASSASTQILTSIHNVVSSQSFGLISNFIKSQKLCYLFRVDVILPPQIYYSLLSNKNQFSPLQYKFFNVLEIITNESELQYQNPKYKELGLSYNIMKTSGSAAILFAICLTVFIIFYMIKQNEGKEQNTFKNVTKQMIQNGAISEDILKRNFMLIYLLFESFVIPTLFIQLSQYWIFIYLQLNQYISIGKNSSTTTDTLSFIFLTTIYLNLLWQPLYICIALLVQLYDYIKQKKQKSNESSHFNYLGQINHPSLITINENFKKLNINHYLRESLYSDYFNELVSSKTWMRSRNQTLAYSQDQIPIQLNNDVFWILEKNAIIYQSQTDLLWRYSIYDENGTIKQTYYIQGLNSLRCSLYTLYSLDEYDLFLKNKTIICKALLDITAKEFSCINSFDLKVQNVNNLMISKVFFSNGDFRFNQIIHVSARKELFKGEFWKQFDVSNSDVFTQSKVNQIKQQVQMTSQASSASTQILTSIHNVVSSQSFGLISNFIMSQKLCYLFLVDVILPPQIYYSLLSNKYQFSPLQYKFFNVLEIITNESELQYQNPKYKELGLSYNIMKTSGSAAILFAICLTMFIIFYLIIQHVKIKIFQVVQIAYNRLFCGTLIQYFQICSTIFIIGINQQIKEFFLLDKDDIEQFKLKIIFCIISLAICILVFFFQSFFLNNIKQNEDEEQSTFKNVTKQMIQNGAISEDILKRNFMLIYLLFESFVIPTLFIQLSQFWIFIYLQINQYISIGKNSSNTTDTLSFIFLTTIYLILLWQPLYICIALLVLLYDYIKQKKQKSKESSHLNYLGQINHPSLITINENFKKLNINYYLRESLYSDYFNEQVSSKTWMRSRNQSKRMQKAQDIILTKQI
ncbi:hypothetical protein ABPG72_022101 [Tetrahymena utriculariae]